MIEKLIKFTAFTIGIINIVLHGYHAGFEIGSLQNSGILSTFGSGYQVLAKSYLYICIFSFILVASSLIKNRLGYCTVSILLLAFIVRLYQNIYLQKSLFLENTDAFTKLLRETIIFDYVSFSLVLILIILQLINIYNYYKAKQRSKI